MLCEMCGKYAATTHIKTNINGQLQEKHLCSACAAKSGYNQSFGLDSLFGSFFGDTLKSQPMMDTRKRCEGCGITFDQIVRTGKVGCDRCYDTFYEQLIPSLQRLHGKAKHMGKIPAEKEKVRQKISKQNELEKLKADMAECIQTQDFEQAAVLRDRIKELEEKDNG